jgi:hypothetical protein
VTPRYTLSQRSLRTWRSRNDGQEAQRRYDRQVDRVADHVGRALLAFGASGIGWHLHQCSDQAQQCLLFRPISAAQEFAQLDVG